MPSPVEALPWGSMSTRRMRLSAAASAVARLTAVVVLPTPPFWFAIAKIRGRDGLVGTFDLPQLEDDAGPVGDARMRRRLEPPGSPRGGDLVCPGSALMEIARRGRPVEGCGKCQSFVQRLQGAGRDDVRGEGWKRLDAGCVEEERRFGHASGLPEELDLPPVGFDKMDLRNAKDREHKAREAGTGAEIDEDARLRWQQREDLGGIDDVTLPSVRQCRRRHEVDPPVPFPKKRDEELETLECF